MAGSTTGIYFVAPDHAAAIQRLAADPEVAATTHLPHPYPPDGAAEFIAHATREREAGHGFFFAIVDRKELVGVVSLRGVHANKEGELGYWIGRPYWGRGYASFAARMVLEFAFRNLKLPRVYASVAEYNAASRRVLEKNHLGATGPACDVPPLPRDPSATLLGYAVTREAWLTAENAPALARLHPDLRRLLEAELAAGNEIAETGGGWPDSDSVFVRLIHPFRARPGTLPAGITYTEPNDPHWWKADYSTASPRHLLAH